MQIETTLDVLARLAVKCDYSRTRFAAVANLYLLVLCNDLNLLPRDYLLYREGENWTLSDVRKSWKLVVALANGQGKLFLSRSVKGKMITEILPTSAFADVRHLGDLIGRPQAAAFDPMAAPSILRHAYA